MCQFFIRGFDFRKSRGCCARAVYRFGLFFRMLHIRRWTSDVNLCCRVRGSFSDKRRIRVRTFLRILLALPRRTRHAYPLFPYLRVTCHAKRLIEIGSLVRFGFSAVNVRTSPDDTPRGRFTVAHPVRFRFFSAPHTHTH